MVGKSSRSTGNRRAPAFSFRDFSREIPSALAPRWQCHECDSRRRRNFMTPFAHSQIATGTTWRTHDGYARRQFPTIMVRPAARSGPRGTRRDARDSPRSLASGPRAGRHGRAFVARTLSSHQVGADHDAATLLTSEIVTNASSTQSGVDGGPSPSSSSRTARRAGRDHRRRLGGHPRREGRPVRGRGTRSVPGPAPRRPVGVPAKPGRHHGLVSPASGRSVAADLRARRPAGRRAGRPPAQPSGSRPADPALGRGDTAHPA
jgi:hypothetical protein